MIKTNRLVLLVLLVSTGCVFAPVLPYTKKQDPYGRDVAQGFHLIKAYTRAWKYYVVETNTPKTPGQRLSGTGAYFTSYRLWLENDKEEAKPIDSMISVLQTDGRYKSYIPQASIKGLAHSVNYSVFEDGGRMYLILRDTGAFVTNFKVHPPNESFADNSKEDPRVALPTIFLGELDPENFVFKVDGFVDGLDENEVNELKKQRAFHEGRYYVGHQTKFRQMKFDR